MVSLVIGTDLVIVTTKMDEALDISTDLTITLTWAVTVKVTCIGIEEDILYITDSYSTNVKRALPSQAGAKYVSRSFKEQFMRTPR